MSDAGNVEVTLTVQNNTEVELGDVADTYAADQARDAAVSLRQVEARQQAPDHPILYNVPETDYLKFYIFQVV